MQQIRKMKSELFKKSVVSGASVEKTLVAATPQ